AEDERGVAAVSPRHLLQNRLPVDDRRARWAIDARVDTTEQQIAGVNDVGLFEEDDRVAARVSWSEVTNVHLLVAEIYTPGVFEGGGGVDRRHWCRCTRSWRLRVRCCLLGYLALPRHAVLVRQDALDGRAKRRVTAGVVAMVVRVDEQLDALWRTLLEP